MKFHSDIYYFFDQLWIKQNESTGNFKILNDMFMSSSHYRCTSSVIFSMSFLVWSMIHQECFFICAGIYSLRKSIIGTCFEFIFTITLWGEMIHFILNQLCRFTIKAAAEKSWKNGLMVAIQNSSTTYNCSNQVKKTTLKRNRLYFMIQQPYLQFYFIFVSMKPLWLIRVFFSNQNISYPINN